MKKRISILGSTGSIGKQALDVIGELEYSVSALAARRNTQLLEEQARAFRPELVCIYEKKLYKEMKDRLSDTHIEVTCGMEGLCRAATVKEADIILNAVVGMIGLIPTLSAIEANKTIALANKETLVAGGKLVMEKAKEKGVFILPVDSEHSAIFQSLQGSDPKEISQIILTASGGPFYGMKEEELKKVTLQDALHHPNWTMGKKITIDSATLMNKGLELIEAAWLFGVSAEQIQILIHRQSILHSAVAFCDGAVIGQMGVPSMKLPIQYALTFPHRLPLNLPALSLADYGALTFDTPDEDTFVCLKVCKESFARGGLYPAAVNAANEEAVQSFLDGDISFYQIGKLVEDAFNNISLDQTAYSLETILSSAEQAKNYVRHKIERERETVC